MSENEDIKALEGNILQIVSNLLDPQVMVTRVKVYDDSVHVYLSCMDPITIDIEQLKWPLQEKLAKFNIMRVISFFLETDLGAVVPLYSSEQVVSAQLRRYLEQLAEYLAGENISSMLQAQTKDILDSMINIEMFGILGALLIGNTSPSAARLADQHRLTDDIDANIRELAHYCSTTIDKASFSEKKEYAKRIHEFLNLHIDEDLRPFIGDLQKSLERKIVVTSIAPEEQKPNEPVEKLLLAICGKLEDAKLVDNVKQIANISVELRGVFAKYPDDETEKLVSWYIEQLLQFLHSYNKAEDLGLTNKDTLGMMENVRKYAEDLVLSLKNIQEDAYSVNSQTIDASIEALRADMRIRGLKK
jgi:hypothetical protein